jgi:hypothetical protein
VETDRDAVWAKLGFPDRRNINVTMFDEPMDVSYSLEELQVPTALSLMILVL